MTPKEYLLTIRYLSMRISMKKKELERLSEEIGYISGMDYSSEPVRSSPNGDTLERQIVRVADLEAEIAEDIADTARHRAKIIDEIMSLGNTDYVRILCMRYVDMLSLSDVARKLNYSLDWVKHLHGRALYEFGKSVLKDDTKKHL